MDETTLYAISIISVLISLAILIYVIILIKRIENNTRTESKVFIEDVLLKYIILNDVSGAKAYMDGLFAYELISAKRLYLAYEDKEAFERAVIKYKEIYSAYNIPTPEDFEDYSNFEYVENKLNLK